MIPKVSRVPRPGVGWFNAVADTVNHFQQNQFNGSSERPTRQSSQTVIVKNTDSEPIGRYRPILITDAVELVDGEGVLLSGEKSSGDVGGLFGIAQEPIFPDATGEVIILGPTMAYLDGTAGDRWGADGETLISGNGRGESLWVPDGTDERLGMILIGSSGCSKRYALGVFNNPANGAGSISVTYNAVTETIPLECDFTPEEIKDAIDAHSEFVIDTVECEVEAASDWPHGIVLVGLPPGATMYRVGDTLVKRAGGHVPEFRVDPCCS